MNTQPPDEYAPTAGAPTTVRTATPPPAGAPDVPGFRILRRIGRGGMGEVWVAEQLAPIRRTVALKIIRPGMDSQEIVARFDSERQALAMMSHPAIAQVFEAGATAAGRPFFVMEYVPGVAITEHCDTHRLSIRERLELFEAVCEGVQHAHQKAIIHRDLKPSNVLVTVQDGRATPKIIDFGVAKATSQRLTEHTMQTQLGQVVGTLEYMSPEQAELTGQDIDTRTDIYALGVMLYELLTGELPFEPRALRSQSFDDLRRTIREVDPPRPSTRLGHSRADLERTAQHRRSDPASLPRQLRGDLDWITMKALEKDRTRRYGSASELAADIRRHLDDQPVIASPPGASYRLHKLLRRHRAAVATAALVAAALVAGLTAATVGFVKASHERDRKEQALQESQAVTGFLSDMLAAVDPSRGGREVSVREVLDRVSGEVGTAFADQPLVEAQLRQTIGDSYAALGLPASAEQHLPRAWELRRRLKGPDDPDTLTSAAAVANLRAAQGRLDEAATLHQEVLAARRRVLGPDAPDTLWSEVHLGNVRFQQGRYREAAELHHAAADAFTERLGEDHPDTLFALVNLASDYWAEGRLAEAEPLFRRVLEVRRRTLGPAHPATLDAINNLAALYHLQGRLDEAEPLYREALESGRRVRGPDHPETLVSAANLGELLADRGRLDDAQTLLESTVASQQRVLGEHHPSTLYTAAVLARLYERRGRPDLAVGRWQAVLDGRRQSLGEDHPDTLEALAGIARCWLGEGRPERARPLLVELIARRRAAADAPDASPAALHECAALLLDCGLADLRDPTAALAYAARADAAVGGADPGILATLAEARHANGDDPGAVAAATSALHRMPAAAPGRADLERRLAVYRAK